MEYFAPQKHFDELADALGASRRGSSGLNPE
jgi:hypothetical protein